MYRALTFLTFLAACAGASKQQAVCAPVAPLPGVSGTVYAECAVDTKAKQVQAPQVDLSFFDNRPGCWTATYDVVVDTAGVPIPITASLVRANDSRYADAVKHKLSSARFIPAKKDGKAVQQLVRIPSVAKAMASRAGTVPSARAGADC